MPEVLVVVPRLAEAEPAVSEVEAEGDVAVDAKDTPEGIAAAMGMEKQTATANDLNLTH